MPSQYDSIGKWISVLHRQFQTYLNQELASKDLNASQFVYLVNLLQEDGINQETLTSRMYIDKGMTARSLKQLEKNGYVKRRRSKTDGRAYEVFVTRKTRALKPEVERILTEWNQLLAKDIPEAEIESLIHVLKEMSDNVLTRQKDNQKHISKIKKKRKATKAKKYEKKYKNR